MWISNQIHPSSSPRKGRPGPSQDTVQVCWGRGIGSDHGSTMSVCQDRGFPRRLNPLEFRMRTGFHQGKRLRAVLNMSEWVRGKKGAQGHPSRGNRLHKDLESRKRGELSKPQRFLCGGRGWDGRGGKGWLELAWRRP